MTKRLKKISIFGFKSFADSTEINFSEGINAIVGPNGCGKSNIAEAFLWALGGGSARSLRASSMQEVIFTGTATRKSMNLAEVVISFSNEDGFLPLPYTEVAVARKLLRSGESTYLINNAAVRLKDVHNLFMHSGVGKEAFAIIGQGKIEEIIRQSPEERRASFEEASEILHFLQERTKAKQKLAAATTELDRLRSIHQEREKQLLSLEKQAKDVVKFKTVQQELTQLEQALLWNRYVKMQHTLERLREESGHLHTKNEQILFAMSQAQAALGSKKEQTKALRQELEKEQEALHALERTKETAARDMRHCHERIQQAEKKQQEIGTMQREHEMQAQRLIEEKEVKKRVLTEIEKQLEELQQAYECKRTELQEFEKATEVVIHTQKTVAAKRFAEQALIHDAETRIKKMDAECAQFIQKIDDKRRQLDSINARVEYLEKEIAEKKGIHATLSGEWEKLQQRVYALQQEQQAIETRCREQEIRVEQQKKEHVEESTQYRLLEQLKTNFEGLAQGTKILLQESKKPDSSLHNRIRPLIDLLVLENPLLERFYTSTLVVETIQDIHRVTEAAIKLKVSDFSVLALEMLGSVALGDHFLSENASSIEEAHARIENSSIVLSKHSFIDSKKVFFWGVKKDTPFFLREQKLQAHKAKSQELEAALKESQELLVQLQQERATVITSVRAADETARKHEARAYEIKYSFEKMVEQQKREAGEKGQIEQALGDVEIDLKKRQALIQEERTKCTAAQELFRESEKAYLEYQEEMNRANTALKTLQNEKDSLLERLNTTRSLLQKTEYAYELVKIRETELTTAAVRMQKEYTEAIEQERAGRALLQTHATKIEKITADVTCGRQCIARIKESMQQTENSLGSLEEEVKKILSEKEQIIAKQAHLQSELEHTQAERTLLQQECRECYAIEADALPIPEQQESDTAAIEQKCKKLRHFLEHTQCNFVAEQEYEELQQNKVLLDQQLKDLEQAAADLQSLIDQVEGDAKRIFQEKFETIRGAFQKNFSILFHGGEADIALEKQKDVLDAGVEIFAKPPGKQMRSLALLSGGEKCLTTIALLFALFEARPAPFCILDEVDAPLDETNVERFGNLLKSFAGTCQFLVVTHNKRTMAIADVLIGVSMQEKGVSQIVPLDFKKIEAREATIQTRAQAPSAM